MVSALNPGSSGLGSSPGLGRCVVHLGETLPQCFNQLYHKTKAKHVKECEET